MINRQVLHNVQNDGLEAEVARLGERLTLYIEVNDFRCLDFEMEDNVWNERLLIDRAERYTALSDESKNNLLKIANELESMP